MPTRPHLQIRATGLLMGLVRGSDATNKPASHTIAHNAQVCIDQLHEYANGVWSAYLTNTILIFIVRSIISHYALIQGYCFG